MINSAVGAASLIFKPLVHRLVCSNGATVLREGGDVLKIRHSGDSLGNLVTKLRSIKDRIVVDMDEYRATMRVLKEQVAEDPTLFVKSLLVRLPNYVHEAVLKSVERAKDKTFFGIYQAITDAATAFRSIPPISRELDKLAERLRGGKEK